MARAWLLVAARTCAMVSQSPSSAFFFAVKSSSVITPSSLSFASALSCWSKSGGCAVDGGGAIGSGGAAPAFFCDARTTIYAMTTTAAAPRANMSSIARIRTISQPPRRNASIGCDIMVFVVTWQQRPTSVLSHRSVATVKTGRTSWRQSISLATRRKRRLGFRHRLRESPRSEAAHSSFRLARIGSKSGSPCARSLMRSRSASVLALAKASVNQPLASVVWPNWAQ